VIYRPSGTYTLLTALNVSHRVRSSAERTIRALSKLTFRFTGQGSEYRLSENPPQVGDIFNRNGDDWTVEPVTEAKDGTSVVTLRPGLKPA